MLNDGRNHAFLASFKDNPLRRRVAAFLDAGEVGADQYGQRAASWLLLLFSDENADVRHEACHVNWSSILDGRTDPTAFVRAYLSSPAFDKNSDQLIWALKKSVSQWPDLTFETIDEVLALSQNGTGGQRGEHYSTMHHLSRVLIELYLSAPAGSVREKDP